MAYSLETSSVKTIVPGAEVSGFCDVVARQAIANLPTLSGGEGVQIVNEDGKNRIDLGLSAGSNMSFVYDQETNTIRLDAEGGTGGIDWTTGAGLSAIVQTSSNSERGFTNMFGVFPSGDGGLLVSSYNDAAGNSYWTVVDDVNIIGKYRAGNDTNYYFSNYYLGNYGITLSAGSHNTSRKESSTYKFDSQGLSYNNTVSATWGPTTSNTTTWTWSDIDYLKSNSASFGKTYTGVAPIQVNNSTNEISITGESLSAGPGINLFESGGYVVISAANGGGGGATYNGISPIDVNNTTHQISAKGVPFGVQEPLFFVQDDNQAVIIGCSAGGGTTYTGDAQGALDEVYANSGVWLTAHQSLADYQTTAGMTAYQTKLDGVNNIVYTASLPATPDANTLYLIPEA